jgi:hypothetical protein
MSLTCALCVAALLTLWSTTAPTRAAAPVQASRAPLATLGPAPDLAARRAQPEGGRATLSTDTLRATQDTFLSSAQPNTNFGGSSRLYVGEMSPYGATRSAVQFDPSQLARNRAVTGARLRLFLREAGPPGDRGRDIPVFRGTSNWTEGGLTWNSCNDCVDSRRLDTLNLGTATGWYEWSITEVVQRWRWPSWQSWHFPNQGLGVQGFEAEGSFRGFDSRESGNRPELVVEHVQDTTVPRSALRPLQPFYNAPDPGQDFVTMRLEWNGEDPQPATGIDYFWVLVKINNGGYSGLTSSENNPPDFWRRYNTNFRGFNGKIYNFVTYATDMAENREPDKPNPDWITHVDWSPPETNLTALPPFVQGDIQLSWTGKDLPEGQDIFPSGLAGYEVWFNINDSSWGLAESLPVERTSTVFVNPENNAHYKFQIVAVDRAGNRTYLGPDSPGQAHTFVDRTAPAVGVLPIDKALAQTTFPVSWSGDDGIGSGVASFDVQTMTGTGAWTDWLTGTAITTRAFTGSLGNTYGFRVRATDRAGNVSGWSAPQWAVVIEPSALRYRARLPLTYR